MAAAAAPRGAVCGQVYTGLARAREAQARAQAAAQSRAQAAAQAQAQAAPIASAPSTAAPAQVASAQSVGASAGPHLPPSPSRMRATLDYLTSLGFSLVSRSARTSEQQPPVASVVSTDTSSLSALAVEASVVPFDYPAHLVVAPSAPVALRLLSDFGYSGQQLGLLPPSELATNSVQVNVANRVLLYFGYYKRRGDEIDERIPAVNGVWPPYSTFPFSGGLWVHEKISWHTETKKLANAVHSDILKELSEMQSSGRSLRPYSPEVAKVIYDVAHKFAGAKIAAGYTNVQAITSTDSLGGVKRRRNKN